MPVHAVHAASARWGLGRWLAAAALGVGLLAPAHADVWAYVDARGIAHFAADKLDDRYELFFRGAQAEIGAGAANPGHPAAETGEGASLNPGAAAEGRGFPLPPAAGVYGVSPYAARLAAYIEGTAGYQMARPLLEDAARTHRIDIALLKALIAAESGFDPLAVSPKGAIGLMQVIPATAERFGVAGDARLPVARKLADPQVNIRTGTRYLRFLLNLFPQQLELALAAYNAGEGAVQRAGNRIPNYPETQNYVRTVMQLYALLKPPPVAASPIQPPAAAPAAPAPAARPALPGAVPGRASMPPSMATALPLLPTLPNPQN